MKNNTNKTQRVTLFIDSAIVKHAKTQAIVEDMSLSNLVKKTLINYLSEENAIKKLKKYEKS